MSWRFMVSTTRGNILRIVTDDDEDDFDGELNRKIMKVEHARLLHRLQRLLARVPKKLSDACSGGRTRGVMSSWITHGENRGTDKDATVTRAVTSGSWDVRFVRVRRPILRRIYSLV